MSASIWDYEPASGRTTGTTLVGFKVEAADGVVGKVDKHSDELGSAYLVVDTGPWIFGKHVLLPAGTVTHIDIAAETIFVGRTKAQIKDAPVFDTDKRLGDTGYHQQIGGYYDSHRA